MSLPQDRRTNESLMPMEIYTDGSLKHIGAVLTFGGWAFAVIHANEVIYQESGSGSNTTNQRMELLATVNALKYAEQHRTRDQKVIIYSDSAYIYNCFIHQWWTGWIKNGWVTSLGEPVKHQDLWIQLVPFFDNFWYDFQKVTAHIGNKWNNYVDQLAQEAAERMRWEYRGVRKTNDFATTNE